MPDVVLPVSRARKGPVKSIIWNAGNKLTNLFPALRPFLLTIAGITPPHPIFASKDNFLRRHFAQNGVTYNINSLDFKNGIAVGDFDGWQYLIHVTTGDKIESTVLLEGCWEPHILRLMDQILCKHRRGIMIDVGANIGASTIPLAIRNDHIDFYCFEPHPSVFEKLKGNLSLNFLDKVHAINAAVSDADDTIKFYAQVGSDNMGMSSMRLNHDIGKHDVIEVANARLDESFNGRTDPVILIKIDVQGAEPAVMKSAESIIRKDKPVIFFEFEDDYFPSETERRAAKETIVGILIDNNYTLYGIQNTPIKFYPKANLFENFRGDLLAISS